MKTFYWILVVVLWMTFFGVMESAFRVIPDYMVLFLVVMMSAITWMLKKIMRV